MAHDACATSGVSHLERLAALDVKFVGSLGAQLIILLCDCVKAMLVDSGQVESYVCGSLWSDNMALMVATSAKSQDSLVDLFKSANPGSYFVLIRHLCSLTLWLNL